MTDKTHGQGRKPAKHATETDLGRFHYSKSISLFKRPRDLSRRAARVLSFFQSLFLFGREGYQGTRVDFAVLARAVADATGEPCGRSTAFAAVKELNVKSYLLRTTTRTGRERQYGPDAWARDKRTQLTVTDKARAVFVGPVPLAATGSLGVQNLNGDNCPRLSPSVKSPPAPGPAPVVSSSSMLSNEVPPAGALHGNRHEGGEEQTPCQDDPPRFTKPTTRRRVIDSILATLAKLLAEKATGRRALARAALEIADPSASPRSPIAWDYWIRRWTEFAQAERFAFARAELVPLLLELDNVFKLADATPGGGAFKQAAPFKQVDPAPSGPVDIVDTMREAAKQGNGFALAWLRNKGLDPGPEIV